MLFLARSDMRWPEKRGRKFFSLFCCDCEKQSPRLFCYRRSWQNWNRKSNYWRDCPTRHWKAISMTVGIGGHLWPHALSWHEVALAIACQFQPTPGFPIPPPLPVPFHPPSPLQQALLPGSLFLFLLPPPKSCSPSLSVSDHADRLSRGRRRGKHIHIHTQGCSCVQRARRWRTKFRVCNHVALFPIRKRLIVDSWRGGNCWLRE